MPAALLTAFLNVWQRIDFVHTLLPLPMTKRGRLNVFEALRSK